MRTLIALLLLTTSALAQGQIPDEATKIWALKRAYQLNGNSMVGNGHMIDVSKEIPGVLPPDPKPMPPWPPKEKPKSLSDLPHNAFNENNDCTGKNAVQSILKDNYQIVIQDGQATRCYK